MLNQLRYTEESRFVLTHEQVLPGVSASGINEDFPLDGARSLYGMTRLGAHFDFFDHRLIFTHRGIVEGRVMSDFEIERVIPQFLPHTSKSRVPQAPWLVDLYLKVPLAGRILSGQMLVVARKGRE